MQVEFAELEAFGKGKGLSDDQIYEADELRQSLKAAAESSPGASNGAMSNEETQELHPAAKPMQAAQVEPVAAAPAAKPQGSSELQAFESSVQHSAGRVLAELFERKAAEALELRNKDRESALRRNGATAPGGEILTRQDTLEAQRLESTAAQLRGKVEQLQKDIHKTASAAKSAADEILKKSIREALSAAEWQWQQGFEGTPIEMYLYRLFSLSHGTRQSAMGRKLPVLGVAACAATAAPLFVVPKAASSLPLPFHDDAGTLRRQGRPLTAPAALSSQATAAPAPRKWRNRLLAAVGVAAAWLWPKMAYARVAKRVVSRADERRAGLYTTLAIAFFFVVAYFNSRTRNPLIIPALVATSNELILKEDDSEEKRIKEEVKRLVRLKKEFEESEEQEDECRAC
eukprot:Skav213263  [mRNA]  locus=scaffold1311:410520:435381:+ [translate_table: standard]